MMGPERQSVRRELGEQHITSALQCIDLAKDLLTRAADDLSVLDGGNDIWRRAGDLRDWVHCLGHNVRVRAEQLRAKVGGLTADTETAAAELRRRRAQPQPEALHVERAP